MKKILLLTLVLVIAAFGIGAGSGIANKFKHQDPPANQQVLNANDTAKNPVNPPTAIPQPQYADPVKISIPKINVNAPVESVGLDAENRMDVPKNSDNGGWYNLGYKPGQKGNAVIAGHYDKKDGSAAVFWDIGKLVAGDQILVTDENGKVLTFEVTRNEKFPYDNFPLQEVFGEASEPMLNLITCEGTWNSTTGMYSHRSVIFSHLVQ
jgi:LPXTG-site transpeptidase (sortase) family protein